MNELVPPGNASYRSSMTAQARSLFRGDQPSPRQSLRRLTARHKAIIMMHLQGKKGTDIADMMGCSKSTVYSIIHDPLSQKVIEQFHRGFDSDLKALFPLAVDAVRRGLNAGDVETALKAVTQYQRLSGKNLAPESPHVVNLNVIGDVRAKFVNEIKAAAAESAPELLESSGDILDSE